MYLCHGPGYGKQGHHLPIWRVSLLVHLNYVGLGDLCFNDILYYLPYSPGTLVVRADQSGIPQNKPIRGAVKRLRDRVKIAFDKSKLTQLISDLRSSNSDLKQLRKQTYALNNVKTEGLATVNSSGTALVGRQNRLPSEFSSYGATRRAAQGLYDALWTAWSTQDATHFRHLAKLFLQTDMKVHDGVYLNLMISCLRQDGAQPLRLAPATTKIHVKSQILDWIPDSRAPQSSDTDMPDRKRRCRDVKFMGDDAPHGDEEAPEQRIPIPHRTAKGKEPATHATPDLRSSQHLCYELLPEHQSVQSASSTPSAVGYLDTRSRDNFRHLFFHCCEGLCDAALCGRGGQKSSVVSSMEPTRLDQLLVQPRSNELSVPDQLQLALRIASAVLKFNSTSWLSEYWGLQDLFLFEGFGADLPASLHTLHLGAEWTQSSREQVEPCTVLDMNPPKLPGAASASASVQAALEEAKLIHGIHNATMYNLGVALLSIGRWTPVDGHDILGVRRMALQACPLGPKFQDMTQRVLDCDFGYGKDLTKPKLQKAIYDGVLVELEGMIATLSFDET